MAIPPLLAWRAGYGGASVQALRLLNGTTLESVQLGAATGFPGSGYDAAFDGPPRHNRIVEFRGDLYSFHRSEIYQFNPGPKVWNLVDSLPNAPNTADDNTISGFEILDVNGELRMYIFYRQSLNINNHVRWTNDGVTWNSGASVNNGTGLYFHRTIVYQGRVWTVENGNSSQVWNYDPVANTWSQVLIGGTPNNTTSCCWLNYKGRLLLFGPNFDTFRAPMQFKELIGGGFVDVSFSGGTDPGLMVTVDASCRCAGSWAFEQNDKIYVIVSNKAVNLAGQTAGEIRCFEFVPNGTAPGSSWQENEITTNVVPPDYRTGGAFANTFHENAALMGYVDVSDPINPGIYFWRYVDTSSLNAGTFWTWVDRDTQMSVVNSDLNPGIQIGHGFNVTNEHVFTEGEFDVTLENAQISPGKVSFDFQVHSPLDGSSIPNKMGRLYYSRGGSDWAVATLSIDGADAPSVVSGGDPAPTISGNLLQGITVGNSKFRAVWNSAADGFVAGERAELTLRVF